MVPTGERQTVMVSATFPEEIQRLATKFLSNYLFLAVGIVGGACSDVEQIFYKVSKFDRRAKLTEILREEGGKKVLVFVETKRIADFLAAFLCEAEFPTTSIHGDRLQSQREEALYDFKSGRMGILVATAVAARGLDNLAQRAGAAWRAGVISGVACTGCPDEGQSRGQGRRRRRRPGSLGRLPVGPTAPF
ncbi:ATP-dependent RNA helicase vasa-like [Schistocerca nitens]|uniref:ATP-dependent RNA helicase vasa-like n=1 Tax=Schistocerca nitens TaxID=7011 RepID=UPI002117C136|nr:ATP-dependent RNA helicase vasa-like [Schistocerca nitens]